MDCKKYYKENRQYIIERQLKYYYENKNRINKDNKIYFQNYYQKNKEKIIKRVQTNYYNKKKEEYKIPKKNIIKNEFLQNNIVISLMD